MQGDTLALLEQALEQKRQALELVKLLVQFLGTQILHHGKTTPNPKGGRELRIPRALLNQVAGRDLKYEILKDYVKVTLMPQPVPPPTPTTTPKPKTPKKKGT
jgi:hypothetical protein